MSRSHVILDLHLCLCEAATRRPDLLLASSYDGDVDALYDAALAYIGDHLSHGEAHTEAEAEAAARRYAEAETASWRAAE